LIFVGSLLLAYASGLHYWALASALVFPVYAVWILVTNGFGFLLRKLTPMALGALLVYGPYAILWVVPQIDNIRYFLTLTNATGGGMGVSMGARFAVLGPDDFVTRWLNLRELGQLYALPRNNLHVPLILAAIPVLWTSRSLRGYGIAGAVLPLFVL